MQGTDDGNIQSGSLFQQSLHLCAVLANNADIIAAGFICPIFFHVQCAKFAETVSGKQHLVIGIVSYNDFRPVDHGSGDKSQNMLTQIQCVAFTNHNAAICIVGTEEVLHHAKSLDGRDDGCFRIQVQEVGHIGRVVGLHVLHHQVIRLALAQDLLQVIQPFMGEILIYCVHDGDLVVQDHIGVIGHTIGNYVLSLKQVYLMVVYTDVLDIVGNGHSYVSLLACSGCIIHGFY